MAILLIISLGTIIILAVISTLTGKGTFTTNGNSYLDEGTQTSWNLYTTEGMYIDQFEGAIIILIVVVMIVCVIGIRIWNSGLSDSSIRTYTVIIFYASLWGIFSALAYDLIVAIEQFGAFLYIFMTILFVIGVFQKINN